MECWWFESALAESPSGGMADTLDLKSNPTQGIGSSPMMGTNLIKISLILLVQLVE
jgi:hypothetical protein